LLFLLPCLGFLLTNEIVPSLPDSSCVVISFSRCLRRLDLAAARFLPSPVSAGTAHEGFKAMGQLVLRITATPLRMRRLDATTEIDQGIG
jgi:hypothetical protein